MLVWTAFQSSIEFRGTMTLVKLNEEKAMTAITRIGMDTAKNVFQVHAVGPDEEVVLRKPMRRLR